MIQLPIEVIVTLIVTGAICLGTTIAITIIEREQQARLRRKLTSYRELIALEEKPMLPAGKEPKQIAAPAEEESEGKQP
jgi:hypothetical protein